MRRIQLGLLLYTVMLILAMPVQAQDAEEDLPPEENVQIRLAHFSPDTDGVDIYVNGELMAEMLLYPDMTDWQVFAPGALEISVVQQGDPTEASLLDPIELTANPGGWYTVAFIGDTATEMLTLQAIEEDFSEIPQGLTRITVFNAIANRRQLVDLFVDDDLLVRGLAYPGTQGDNDGAATVDILAAEYELRLTDTVDENRVFFTSQSVLGTNRHYFIAAIGRGLNPNGYFVSTDMGDFSDEGTAEPPESAVDVGEGVAQLRVGHFAAGTDDVDLYLNLQLSQLQEITYGGLTEWVTVPVGVYEATFTAVGAPINTPIIPAFDVILVEDSWNTLIVVSQTENDALVGRLILEDYSPIPENNSRITFFHGMAGAPPLEIQLNQELFGPLVYPGNLPSGENGSEVVTIEAGAYDITFFPEGDTENPVLSLPPGTQLAPGNHYFIATIDQLENPNLYVQAVTQSVLLEETP